MPAYTQTVLRSHPFHGFVVLVLCLAAANQAHADARAYRGPHPLDLEGHWDLDTGVHVHDTLTVGLDPFASVDGVLVFLGDPVAYGYSGDTWSFVGAHPLSASVGLGYCGISGAHRHHFAPEGEGSYRRASDGSYAFAGTMHGGVSSYVPGRLAPPATAPIVARASTPAANVAVGVPTPLYLFRWPLHEGRELPRATPAAAAPVVEPPAPPVEREPIRMRGGQGRQRISR